MSVVKSKRTKSELEVVNKAIALASYTIHICSNEKNFPKRYRWCLTGKMDKFYKNLWKEGKKDV